MQHHYFFIWQQRGLSEPKSLQSNKFQYPNGNAKSWKQSTRAALTNFITQTHLIGPVTITFIAEKTVWDCDHCTKSTRIISH